MKALAALTAIETVVLASAVGGALQSAAAGIILFGGVCTAVPLIWKFFIKPTRALYSKTMKLLDLALGDENTPDIVERFDQIGTRFDGVEARVGEIESHIDVIAAAERHGVRSALQRAATTDRPQ